jgi:hypothetical protein
MSQMDTRILQKIEKKMCKKSDSIVIIYKSKLENCLSFIQSESQFVQWVKISNVAFDLQNDIIVFYLQNCQNYCFL